MRHQDGRNGLLMKAVKLTEYLSQPAWRSRHDVAELLNCHYKTAQRWITALEAAGYPLEVTGNHEEGERFRRMR